jgi:diguanylate cyclase (GGDEF)-like protein
VRHQSTHDSLTGLINRHDFEGALGRSLAEAKRNGSRHVLCYIDIDQFSTINTSCGYAAGDDLLKQVATMIAEEAKDQGTLARLGSDEFGLLLENCLLDDALAVAEKQIEAASQFRIEWENNRMSIGLSIGLVPLNARTESVANVWRAAESSCRLAKEVGGSRLQVYHSGHARLSHQDELAKWIGKIDHLIEDNQLFLRCQRIVPIQSGLARQPRFEILLGVLDDLGQAHSPQQFIEAAEWYHRMPAVDFWVIRNALDWMASNLDVVARVGGFAINLSGQSLIDDRFATFIIRELGRTQVPPDKVVFEVTETVGITNLSDASVFIQQVKDAGCKFSLDDFGSGMSSYAYLKNLPVDVLKIDGAFVRQMDSNASDYAVVKSMCEIGHFMKKMVVAEYVESDAIFQLLCDIGVDYAQGYFIERPMLLADLKAM